MMTVNLISLEHLAARLAIYAFDRNPNGRSVVIMSQIKELSLAVNVTDDWIDDLLRRLGWHDRERSFVLC